MVMPDGEPQEEDPQEWGKTDTSSVSAEITACRRNGEWCAILEKVTGHYFIRSKLPTFPSTGPVQPVVCTGDPQTSNTTADNYRCQVGDLIDGGTGFNNFPTCRPDHGWYVLGAIEAHEAYHETRLLPSLENVAAGAGSLFESVCVPDVGQGQAAAVGQLQSDPAFEQAEDVLFQQWKMDYLALLADDHGSPPGTGGAYGAQRSVTRPVEQCICSMAAANGWGPCP